MFQALPHEQSNLNFVESVFMYYNSLANASHPACKKMKVIKKKEEVWAQTTKL